MGLYIIRELVDEAGFVQADDEDEGNRFRMVIYRVGDGEENRPEASASGADKGDTT
jgi:hypothetical protein